MYLAFSIHTVINTEYDIILIESLVNRSVTITNAHICVNTAPQKSESMVDFEQISC